MYLCVLKKIALKPAPIREVASKCASEVSKSGEPDLEKAAMILLTEYRSGKLGRISLETPESREAM